MRRTRILRPNSYRRGKERQREEPAEHKFYYNGPLAQAWRSEQRAAALFSIVTAGVTPMLYAAKTKIAYSHSIEPLLARRCYICDGSQQQMSGLPLDRKDSALEVFQPGNSLDFSKPVAQTLAIDGVNVGPARRQTSNSRRRFATL